MRRILTVGLIVGTVSVFAGCGHQRDPLSSSAPQGVSGLRGRVASGARLDSAHLLLHVRQPGGELIVVHPADQPWLESTVTWNAVGPWVSLFVISIFSAVDTGEIKIDVSTLVNGWLVGTRPNNGILLDQNPPYVQRTRFDSRESGAGCPKLRLFLSDADSTMIWTFRATGDAYVDENYPDANMGQDSALYSGYEVGMPGENRTMMNFDLSAPQAFASVGDRIWQDDDGDGIQGAGEVGIPNVTVILYDCFDTPMATTVSDADGIYHFDSLATGAYRVELVLPAGYLFSPKSAGTDSDLDSDIDPVTGSTDCFALVEGVVDLQWDAGLVPPTPATDGCTHGLGYWKHHSGFGKQDDSASMYLPIWLGSVGGAKSIELESSSDLLQVLQMMAYGHPSNGITKLYARLLVAKLNLASGAYSADADAIADEVDLYLADTDWNDWSHLSNDERQVVAAWRSQLQRYNDGEVGPGSCDNPDGP